MHLNFSIRSLTLRSLSLALVILAMSAGALAQFRVSITIAPPALPVYEQPVCPGDGYIWTPGYWYWDDDAGDYYWVPGTWVEAPEVGGPVPSLGHDHLLGGELVPLRRDG